MQIDSGTAAELEAALRAGPRIRRVRISKWRISIDLAVRDNADKAPTGTSFNAPWDSVLRVMFFLTDYDSCLEDLKAYSPVLGKAREVHIHGNSKRLPERWGASFPNLKRLTLFDHIELPQWLDTFSADTLDLSLSNIDEIAAHEASYIHCGSILMPSGEILRNEGLLESTALRRPIETVTESEGEGSQPFAALLALLWAQQVDQVGLGLEMLESFGEDNRLLPLLKHVDISHGHVKIPLGVSDAKLRKRFLQKVLGLLKANFTSTNAHVRRLLRLPFLAGLTEELGQQAFDLAIRDQKNVANLLAWADFDFEKRKVTFRGVKTTGKFRSLLLQWLIDRLWSVSDTGLAHEAVLLDHAALFSLVCETGKDLFNLLPDGGMSPGGLAILDEIRFDAKTGLLAIPDVTITTFLRRHICEFLVRLVIANLESGSDSVTMLVGTPLLELTFEARPAEPDLRKTQLGFLDFKWVLSAVSWDNEAGSFRSAGIPFPPEKMDKFFAFLMSVLSEGLGQGNRDAQRIAASAIFFRINSPEAFKLFIASKGILRDLETIAIRPSLVSQIAEIANEWPRLKSCVIESGLMAKVSSPDLRAEGPAWKGLDSAVVDSACFPALLQLFRIAPFLRQVDIRGPISAVQLGAFRTMAILTDQPERRAEGKPFSSAALPADHMNLRVFFGATGEDVPLSFFLRNDMALVGETLRWTPGQKASPCLAESIPVPGHGESWNTYVESRLARRQSS
ncbi:MAG: hypothetical protein ACOYM2_16045 [Rectinemataceae bacterium]